MPKPDALDWIRLTASLVRSAMLRPGNAGSNTAADHITVTREALRQLPFTVKGGRVGRKVLIRADAAGGTHAFLGWPAAQHLGYSLGFTLPDDAVTRPGPHHRQRVDPDLRQRAHST